MIFVRIMLLKHERAAPSHACIREGKSIMFINFSNHPSVEWSKAQIDAATIYGEIIDIPFPQISAAQTEEELKEMTKKVAGQIGAYHPDCVLVQGEMTFTHALVNALKKQGILTVAAVSERISKEQNSAEGTLKTSLFCFVKFREYY